MPYRALALIYIDFLAITKISISISISADQSDGRSGFVAVVEFVDLPDQRRPGECAAHAAGLYPHGFGHALDDQRVDLRQLAAAGLRVDLDTAGVFKGLHAQKRVGNGLTHCQQAVVAQHQKVSAAQIGLQARLFIVAKSDTFIAVVGQ